jgi:hypothetical protein
VPTEFHCWEQLAPFGERTCRYFLWACKHGSPSKRIGSLSDHADQLQDKGLDTTRVGIWCQLAVATDLRPGC